MDEITLFAALRPATSQDQVTAAAGRVRTRLAGRFGPEPARRRWRVRLRRRTVLLAACGAALAIAAVIVVPVIVPGGGAGPLSTAAWAVQRNPNGTIKVTMRQARDPAGLQRALRADGILAYVRYSAWIVKKQGNTFTGGPAETCQAAGGRPVPGKVVEAAFPFPAGGAPNQGYALTIDPAAVPAGDAVLIQVTWGGQDGGFGIDVQDTVMGTSQPPVCVPQRY